MVQLRDVTESQNYHKKILENKLLGVIQACLSHELRNPLNSIIAQNIQKKVLYQQLENHILEIGVPLDDQESRAKAQSLISKLN
jgi:signal transduction histidine kinase